MDPNFTDSEYETMLDIFGSAPKALKFHVYALLDFVPIKEVDQYALRELYYSLVKWHESDYDFEVLKQQREFWIPVL